MIPSSLSGRICLFSTYFVSSTIPYYVKAYILELRKHFGRVIVVTNDDRPLVDAEKTWLEEHLFELMLVKNEGLDFGMWFKALKHVDANAIERLALINDSCILFAPLNETFDWIERSNHDVCGLVDSLQRSYHLQSFFLYFKKSVIPHVLRFFTAQGIVEGGFWNVVDRYEVGLSTFLMAEGHTLGVRYSIKASAYYSNPSMELVEPLLKAGMPMIKRKALNMSFGKHLCRLQILSGYDPDPRNYIRIIQRRYGVDKKKASALFSGLIRSDFPTLAKLRWWKLKYGTYRLLHLRSTHRIPPICFTAV